MSDDDNECAISGCFLEPAFDAYIILRPKSNDPKARAEASLGLSLCAGCASDAKIGDFIDDAVWARIEDGFAKIGKAIPVRHLTKLDLRPRPKVLLP